MRDNVRYRRKTFFCKEQGKSLKRRFVFYDSECFPEAARRKNLVCKLERPVKNGTYRRPTVGFSHEKQKISKKAKKSKKLLDIFEKMSII